VLDNIPRRRDRSTAAGKSVCDNANDQSMVFTHWSQLKDADTVIIRIRKRRAPPRVTPRRARPNCS